MMQLTSVTVPAQAATPRLGRSSLVVRASAEPVSRRNLGLLATALGLVAVVPAASAKKLPFQEAMRSGSSTEASMSAFSMEGIKKRGISPKKRAELLAEAKAKASEAIKAVTK